MRCFSCWIMFTALFTGKKQECIPVGCVPAAHWPYAGVCFPGGMSGPRGVSASGGCLLLGGMSAPRGCLVSEVSAPKGVSAPGGCLLPGGVWPMGGGWLLQVVCSQGVSDPWGCLLQGGVCSGDVVSQHALRQTPLPREQNDKQVQKYYLGHNFVAAGKNVHRGCKQDSDILDEYFYLAFWIYCR